MKEENKMNKIIIFILGIIVGFIIFELKRRFLA